MTVYHASKSNTLSSGERLGLPGPIPGFDDPMGVLRACHQRLLERLDTLEQLVDFLTTQEPDSHAIRSAQLILNYFDHAAEHHHQDEEEDLFPMLREITQQKQPQTHLHLESILSQLIREHTAMASYWDKLYPALSAITRGLQPEPMQCQDMIRMYRAHIDTENHQVFPIAEECLPPSALQALGRAMQERRGLLIPTKHPSAPVQLR